jgi:hypothetical protein
MKQLEPGSLADRIHALMCSAPDEAITEGDLARKFDVPPAVVRNTLEDYARDDYFKREAQSRSWMLGDLVVDRPAGPLIVPASPWQAPLPAGEAIGFDEVPPPYQPPSKSKRLRELIDAQLSKPGLFLEGLAASDRDAVKKIVEQRHSTTTQRYALRKASATTFNLYRLAEATPATVHSIKRAA